MTDHYFITYAQNREDVLLNGFFDDSEIGVYVDIGAFDPEYDSVTKSFYSRGWSGINVEPQQDRYRTFIKKRPRDINVNVGISDKNSTLNLRSYTNQGWSTFSSEMKAEYESNEDEQTSRYTEYSVKVITLKQLFKAHNITTIQFMKVDVEGLEFEVLEGNDWEQYRPEVICIEANHIIKDWRPMLRQHDYSLVFFDGLNEYYADNNTNRAQKFDYINAVIMREPIVNYKLLEDFDKYEATVKWLDSGKKSLEAEIEKARKVINDQQTIINHLQSSLDAIVPLRKHIRKSILNQVSKLDHRITYRLQRIRPHKAPEVHYHNVSGAELLVVAAKSDQENFSQYLAELKTSKLIPIYIKSKKLAVKAIRKGLRFARKIKR